MSALSPPLFTGCRWTDNGTPFAVWMNVDDGVGPALVGGFLDPSSGSSGWMPVYYEANLDNGWQAIIAQFGGMGNLMADRKLKVVAAYKAQSPVGSAPVNNSTPWSVDNFNLMLWQYYQGGTDASGVPVINQKPYP